MLAITLESTDFLLFFYCEFLPLRKCLQWPLDLLNNHIGVPLTLLQINQKTEFAVIEMGANHQKEIEAYCVYTMPTHGVITNCGKAHLEGFGGEEGGVADGLTDGSPVRGEGAGSAVGSGWDGFRFTGVAVSLNTTTS